NLGAKKIIIGIGGSATNDGGAGMLQALGFQFYNSKNNVVIPSGGMLGSIARIEPPSTLPTKGIELILACDVNNPSTGPLGATMVYAKQKGARDKDLEELESGMVHYAQLVEEITNSVVTGVEGFGAAGGVPISACSFLNAELVSGSKLIFDALKMEGAIKNANVVITGEGKIDAQTNYGKAIIPIIECAARMNKNLILVCGVFEEVRNHLAEITRYELSQIAEKRGMNSFADAYDLCFEIGRQIGFNLQKQR
ncbi:MAG: glycerate kinase, partial [Bacteroidota bacterium]